MPFNGVGLFQRLYNWTVDAAANLNILADRMDNDTNDIAAGLSNCVTRDGQSPWLANLPANGFKLTGLGSGASNGDSVNYGQVFINPVFTNASSSNTVSAADNSKKYATTEMVQQVAFSATTPAQPGGPASYNLTSLAGVASWQIPKIVRSARSTNTVLSIADSHSWVDITSGTFAQTFGSAASLGLGWCAWLGNSGNGDVTLTPAGADTIDGATSRLMYPGEVIFIESDGVSNFNLYVVKAFEKTFTANGNFIKPSGYKSFSGKITSAGSSGAKNTTPGTVVFGGSAGGSGDFWFPSSLVPSTVSVTIGQGGAAQTVVGAGNTGTATSLGSLITAYGGPTPTFGGSIVQSLVAMTVKDSTNSNTIMPPVGYEGGRPGFVAGDNGGINSVWGGAAPADTGATGGNSVHGGAAGGGITSANVASPGGISIDGGNGGAAGLAVDGVDGVAPGGGGGATRSGSKSGAGARGELKIRGVA